MDANTSQEVEAMIAASEARMDGKLQQLYEQIETLLRNNNTSEHFVGRRFGEKNHGCNCDSTEGSSSNSGSFGDWVFVKEEGASAAKSTATEILKAPPPSSSPTETGSTSSTGPFTEEEIRAFLLQTGPVTSQDIVSRFKSRLRSPEEKKAFAEILRRISRIQGTTGSKCIVLREE